MTIAPGKIPSASPVDIKYVASIGGKRHVLLICGDFSSFTWTYFMRQNSNTVALFGQFLADERVAGTPSAVDVVR